jgi:predicted metalloprotease
MGETHARTQRLGALKRRCAAVSAYRRRADAVRARGASAGWAVIALLVAATLVAALSQSGDEERRPGEASTSSSASATTTAGSAAAGDGVDLLASPGDLSVTLAATTASLREYWSDQMDAVYGKQFRPLAGGVQPKTASSKPWSCGGTRYTYADIRGNAFYCGGPHDDYIAYDAAFLMPRLNEEFGGLTPAVVLAHEMGHAIQARAGVDAPSVVRELQADCFAGAWVAFAQHSDSDPVTVAASALDSSVRALPTLRDQPGTPGTNPQAHGLGFDRVNAYQTGYESGASECARFPEGRAVVTELPFSTVEEALSGGNLDYADTVRFAVESLDAFWSAALPQLGPGDWADPRATPVSDAPLPGCPDDEGYEEDAVAAYCAPHNAVVWSTASLARLHQSVGDLAAASALSLAWARAAQVQADEPSAGSAARLQEVCETGAWVAAVAADRSTGVSISPGDIDEALLAVLARLTPSGANNGVTSGSFARVDAFRTGLLHGLADC